jgi:hypothetical protein
VIDVDPDSIDFIAIVTTIIILSSSEERERFSSCGETVGRTTQRLLLMMKKLNMALVSSWSPIARDVTFSLSSATGQEERRTFSPTNLHQQEQGIVMIDNSQSPAISSTLATTRPQNLPNQQEHDCMSP